MLPDSLYGIDTTRAAPPGHALEDPGRVRFMALPWRSSMS